jgi:CHASE2 domain-containing sensor protein
MKKMNFLIIVFVLGIFMPINTQKSFSAENLKAAKLTDFKTEDLRKREINTADLRGKIIIIGFSTQDTSDYMIEWQTEVGYETGITQWI